jgi:hypothetical protein
MQRLMLYFAILLLSPLVGITHNYWAKQPQSPVPLAASSTVTKGPQIPLPTGVVTDTYTTMTMSKTGRVGFLTSSYGGGLWAFNLDNGELQGQLLTGDRAGQMTLYERNDQRLLAVVHPIIKQGTKIVIVNAQQPFNLQLVATITLPATTEVAPTLAPVFTPDGRYLILATTNPGSLSIWETATGHFVSELPIPTGATSLTASFQKNTGLLALTHPTTNKISLIDWHSTETASPGLTLRTEVTLPAELGLISANNFSLDRRTKTGYIASFTGNKVLAIDLASGEIRDTLAVGDAPARLARIRHQGQHYLAVVNTGLKHGFLADTVSLIELAKDGNFGSAGVFIPPGKVDLTPDTHLNLTAKYGLITGERHIWAFDIATGDLMHTLVLPGKPTNFVAKGLETKIWALSQTNLVENLNLYTLATPAANPNTSSDNPVVTSGSAKLNTSPITVSTTTTNAIVPITESASKGDSLKTKADSISAVLAPRISSARFLIDKRGLALSVVGRNFSPMAKVRINKNNFATRRETAERFLVRLPWRILRQGTYLSITVENETTTEVVEFKKPLIRQITR